MRAYRDEAPLHQNRSGKYLIIVCLVTAVALVALVYVAMRDAAAPGQAQPASMPVVRDPQPVAQPPVNTADVAPPLVQEAAPLAGAFAERRLGAPRTALGVGEAPTAGQPDGETFVIDGELLEKIEAEAAAATEKAQTNQ